MSLCAALADETFSTIASIQSTTVNLENLISVARNRRVTGGMASFRGWLTPWSREVLVPIYVYTVWGARVLQLLCIDCEFKSNKYQYYVPNVSGVSTVKIVDGFIRDDTSLKPEDWRGE